MLKKIQYCDLCKNVVSEEKVVKIKIPKKNDLAYPYVGKPGFEFVNMFKEFDVCNNCLRRYHGVHLTARDEAEQITLEDKNAEG